MNVSERLIKSKLEDRGFTVLRNGWPDFLCTRKTPKLAGLNLNGDEVFDMVNGACAVEVKSRTDRLSPEQREVHRVLRLARIPVYVVKPHEMTDISAPRRRVFLTNAEISHLKSMAGHAQKQAAALGAEMEKLAARIADINAMIEAAGATLEEAGFLLQPTSLDLQIGDYSLPKAATAVSPEDDPDEAA